ncbi:MAG: hypothetical protein M0Z46_11790 [Actinomycetota bacterium]|jgi:pyruvate/2-oxoglutarate dehydrogenase complex dihydrolipoamide acyltransferase (E2) component|nr:hypothetical protein [Actinomycetota bacterium]
MIEVRVPKVGMSTLEVEIGEVRVAVGQRLSANSVVCTALADKVDFDVEAGAVGTVVEILVASGDVVPVSGVVARLAEDAT